jgi:hypothetical protein
MVVVIAVAVVGMVAIAPAASAADVGYSWFPPGVYAKFSQGETSAIVQVGAGGAAAYASAQMPHPALKAVAAMLGVGLWLTARNAHESADRKCMVIIAAVWKQTAYPVAC